MTKVGSEVATAAKDGPAVAGMPRRPDYIADADARPHLRCETKPRFPFPLPNGWFIVAEANEIAPREVKSVYYFGRDLVLYRTADGQPRLVSAYCAHLGAHLAAGGKVEDDAIMCPFHGWNYDGVTGKCVTIPYGSVKIPSQAKIRAYPTIERNHMVRAWFHLEGKPRSPTCPRYESSTIRNLGSHIRSISL